MASREQKIAVSFEAYNDATRIAVESGEVSEYEGGVYQKFGTLVKVLVENRCPNISDGEVMALLSLTQDYAGIILGAIDSDSGKNTKHGVAYRKAVVPLLLTMLTQGVIEEEDLPKGMAPAAEKAAQ
jgi:hypothetical protein